VPPLRFPVEPAIRVRVIGSDRLRLGLSEAWTVVAHHYPRDPELTVVEVVGGRLPDCVDAVETAYVVWATAGGPPTDGANASAGDGATPELGSEGDVSSFRRNIIDEAAAVFVADPDQLEAWQAVAPTARLLPPAASSRVLPVRERAGVAVVATGSTSPDVAGALATVVTRALRPLEESLVARRVDTSATLPRLLSYAVAGDRSYADARDAIASSAVLADGLRCSRHDTWTVLDAAAAGTPVVSIDGLPQPFPVATADREQGFRAELVARLQQPELRDREGLRLRREVLAGHTWAHRAEVIAGAIGLDRLDRRTERGLDRLDRRTERGLDRLDLRDSSSAGDQRRSSLSRPHQRSVSAIVPTNRVHELDNVLSNIARQRHTDVELVLVLHGLEVDAAELRKRAADAGVGRLELVHTPSSYTLGACLNAGIERAGGEVIAKMDDDNYYGGHYLTDLLHGFGTSGAGIVGKWAHYVWLQSTGAVVLRYPDAEYTYQRRIQGGSMLFDGDLVRELRFGDLPRAVDSDILDRALADGVKVWSGDRFNYVSIRGVDRQAHTWTVDDATFLTASGRLAFYGDPRAHVEV